VRLGAVQTGEAKAVPRRPALQKHFVRNCFLRQL
jgi:hypothetical protein